MHLSARNQLKGRITLLKKGPINTEVRIVISGGDEITAIITSYSAEQMNLKEGLEVYAVMKASEVIIGTD